MTFPDRLRLQPPGWESEAGGDGVFGVQSVEPGWGLYVIATNGVVAPDASHGWEHVSVHARRGAQVRTPTWKEMCQVKDLFWGQEDVVMQLHPRRSEYVNHHPHVLHLWRHPFLPIPEPPASLVGPKA